VNQPSGYPPVGRFRRPSARVRIVLFLEERFRTRAPVFFPRAKNRREQRLSAARYKSMYDAAERRRDKGSTMGTGSNFVWSTVEHHAFHF